MAITTFSLSFRFGRIQRLSILVYNFIICMCRHGLVHRGKKGLTGYLQMQANANPSAFMALLGKVLPLQMAGVDGVRQLVEVKLSVVQSEQQTSKQRVLDAKPLAQPQQLGSTWETPSVTRLKLGDAK